MSAPEFKSSEIYVVTSILKETVFIPFQVFSDKISSEMERFTASRNSKIFFATNYGQVRG